MGLIIFIGSCFGTKGSDEYYREGKMNKKASILMSAYIEI